MDFGFTGDLFTHPAAGFLTMLFALVEGLVAGSIAVALTAIYRRR